MEAANSATETLSISTHEWQRLLDTVEALRRENRALREKVHYLTQQRFGRSSEAFESSQQDLFGEAPAINTDDAEEASDDTQERPARKKGGRRKPPKDLTRVRVEHDLSEDEKHCQCGACLSRIGEVVSEQYDVIPARFQILEHVRFKYACPVCDAHGVTVAPKAADPLPRHQVSPGLLAQLGVSKYVDGLPINRQAKIFAQRFGIPFTDTTLAQWMIQGHERLLIPVLECFSQQQRGVAYLQADETTLQVLEEPDRRAWQKSYFWLRISGVGPPVILLTYAPSRAGAVAEELFEGFNGYLQIDAYAGYNPVLAREGVTGLGCWAHARRRFDILLKSAGRKTPEASVAREGLGLIKRLYQIEREIKDKPPDERLRRRQSDSRAVCDEIEQWMQRHLDWAGAQGGALGRAFGYLSNQWEKLQVYLTDQRLYIDNNRAERHIRPIAQGRKAWLFARSQKGAEASAGWYSVVETAKANGLEPFHYLRWLFTHLPMRLQEEQPIDDLMPWKVSPAEIGMPNGVRG